MHGKHSYMDFKMECEDHLSHQMYVTDYDVRYHQLMRIGYDWGEWKTKESKGRVTLLKLKGLALKVEILVMVRSIKLINKNEHTFLSVFNFTYVFILC